MRTIVSTLAGLMALAAVSADRPSPAGQVTRGRTRASGRRSSWSPRDAAPAGTGIIGGTIGVAGTGAAASRIGDRLSPRLRTIPPLADELERQLTLRQADQARE
jgi:hypothetical protein